MAITKPIVSGYPDLKVVKKNVQTNISLAENFEHLYTDKFTLAVGETYFTEAILAGQDTALFLWADNTLLVNSKNQIKFTNDSAGPMEIQLVIKLYDALNDNGTVLPAGNYSMWKGDLAFSNGDTELPVPARLCVNSRIYARDEVGEIYTERHFGREGVYVAGNKVIVVNDTAVYFYTSEGVYVSKYLHGFGYSPNFDASFDAYGNGYVALGFGQKNLGSASGTIYSSGSVVILDQDGTFLQEIDNLNAYGAQNYDYFGDKVAVSHEGILCVVATGEDTETTTGSGSGATISNFQETGWLYIIDISGAATPLPTVTVDLHNVFDVEKWNGSSVNLDVHGYGASVKIILSHDGTAPLEG